MHTATSTLATAALAPLAAVIQMPRRRVTTGDNELTGGQVAARVGVHPTTILRIPKDRLPYRTTPGGHRRYALDDVERYQQGLDPARPAPRSIEDRLSAVEAEVADLQQWRRSKEGSD